MQRRKKTTQPETLGKTLGRAIAERRKARGLTQDELAGLVEVDAVTISRFETGTSMPSIERLLTIAEAVGVGVGELLSVASPLVGDRAQQLAATMHTLAERDQRLLVDFALLLKKR